MVNGYSRGWVCLGVFVLAAASFGAGCGGEDRSLYKPAQTVAATSGGSQGGAGGTMATTASGAGGEISLTTGSGGASTGCEKVDFVFIVDNSVSMAEQQAALIKSFPSFISTIQSTIKAGSDYHIMVVDTDAETRCTPANCKSGAMNAKDLCINTSDGGYACKTSFEKCDSVLGAGVVHAAGEGASNQDCMLEGGQRYIVEAEADKEAAFSCIAKVGLAGHPQERPMDAMVASLAADINAPDGCNAGFLREDAILVLTFISDDPNYEDEGTPQDWYDAVVAAKGGNAEAVAVLGFTPAFQGCATKPGAGDHWSEFIALWGDRGLEASVCEDDYGAPFTEAVKIIDETCDEFSGPK